MIRNPFSESHFVFASKEVISAVGLNNAIVLQQVHYWCEINKGAGRNFYDGRYWTYNTYEEWAEQFFWWSKPTIIRMIAKLEQDGFLLSANYNKMRRDRTKWYAVNYDAVNERITSYQNDNMQLINLITPLPTINLPTNNNKNIKGRFPKKTTEGFISSLVEDYGEERVTAMIDAVNSYIDDWYVDETCRNHPQEGKYKRAVFAKKLLECADKTGIDDDTVVNGLYKALINHPDDVDPQIYYATSDKPLGNGLLATNEIDYCQIAGTDYDINT